MSTHLHHVGDEPPVRLDDLYAYFHAGSKPRSAWRVGALARHARPVAELSYYVATSPHIIMHNGLYPYAGRG